MRHLTNHERRNLTPAQRALVNTDPAARVRDLQDPNVGGFTVSPVTGNKPTEGISVAVPGHEEVHKTASLTKEKVAAYAVHPQRLSEWTRTGQTGIHYGGWASEGDAYLDVSRVHDDTPEGRQASRRAQVAGNQLASYDLGRGLVETNPMHPGNLPEKAREQVRPVAGTEEAFVNDTRPVGSGRISVYEPKDRRIRRGFS